MDSAVLGPGVSFETSEKQLPSGRKRFSIFRQSEDEEKTENTKKKARAGRKERICQYRRIVSNQRQRTEPPMDTIWIFCLVTIGLSLLLAK